LLHIEVFRCIKETFPILLCYLSKLISIRTYRMLVVLLGYRKHWHMGQNRRFCNRYKLLIYRSPDTVLGRESRLFPERPRSRGWIPCGGRFFSSPKPAARLSVQPILLFVEWVKVEVNLTPWHACASREGRRGTVTTHLKISTRNEWVVKTTPWMLYLGERRDT
jgi:hypothetical protein